MDFQLRALDRLPVNLHVPGVLGDVDENMVLPLRLISLSEVILLDLAHRLVLLHGLLRNVDEIGKREHVNERLNKGAQHG